MAYVIVNAKGLSGAMRPHARTVAGGPAPAVRGGMQRGMRDGEGPTFVRTQAGLFREPAVYTPRGAPSVSGPHGHHGGHHGGHGGHGGRRGGGGWWGMPVYDTDFDVVDVVQTEPSCPPGFLRDYDGRCIPDPRLPAAIVSPVSGYPVLSGPLKLTIEHLGGGRTMRPGQEHVRGGLRGLGDTGPISEQEARERIAALFTSTCQSWIELLNKAMDDMPLLSLDAGQPERAALGNRRDQITNQVIPAGLDVIGNQTIPLKDVAQRVTDFLTNFFDVVKLDIHNAQQDEKNNTILGLLRSYVTALETVVAATGKEVAILLGKGLQAVPSAFPSWVLPLAALAGVVYVVHTVRSWG